MNLLHVKTNTVADFTGTVTVYNQTGGSQTMAATDLVRPSDWNSQHKMLLTFAGNTTGGSTISGTAIPIAGAGGVSVGGSNGSFVISGMTDPGWLTTAAQSNHSHGNPTLALTNLNGTTNSASNGFTLSLSAAAQSVQPAVGLNTAATNVTWTVNSSGISIDASGYAGTGTTFNGTNIQGSLTQNSAGIRVDLSVNPGGAADGYNSAQFTNSTANSTMPVLWAGNSNGSGNITFGLTGSTVTGSAPSGGAGAAISAGAQSQNTGTVIFSNGGGVSFGLNAGTLTATVKTDYLTTARASNDAVGLNTALTAGPLAWTVNSGGISLNAGSAAGTTSGFGGNLISGSMTHNTAGLNLSLNHPAWLTTAAHSTHSHDMATTTTNGSLVVVATENSNGYTLGVPPFITTAAVSDHSHGNPTLALTNLTGTTASNSAGFTLSLSAVGGGVINQTGPNIAAGTRTATSGTVVFSNANNISFGLATNDSVVTASFNPINIGISNVGNTAGTTGTFDGANLQYIFAGGNNITLSQSSNGSSVTLTISGAAGGGGNTLSTLRAIEVGAFEWLTGQYGQNQPFFFPMAVEAARSVNMLRFPILFSGATNSTGTLGLTMDLGFYTWGNSTSLNLLTSFRATTQVTHSGTQNSVSNVGGIRFFENTLAAVLINASDYVVGFRSSTSSAGAGASFSHWVASNINTAQSGWLGSNTNATFQLEPGLGYLSTSSSALPSGVALSQMSGTNTYLLRPILWTVYRTT